MRSRRAKHREDGRCAHAYVRPVWATTEAEPHRGTAIVLCVHCAAFWIAGRMGWHDNGSTAANLAMQAPEYVGYRTDTLGDVSGFKDAIRLAERAAGI